MTTRIVGAMFGAMMMAMPTQTMAFETGQDLMEMASRTDEAWPFGVFSGYVIGMVHADFVHSRRYGVPRIACPGSTTVGEWTATVLKWMRQNPDRLDEFSWDVVMAALQHHYPCKPDEEPGN